MLVKSKATRALLEEGTYPATLKLIVGRPSDDAPKKLIGTFSLEGRAETVEKDWPATLEPDSPLLKDVETLLGRELTRAETDEGFDLKEVFNKPCQVIVMNKTKSGGRIGPAVSIVLPPTIPAAK